MENFEIMLRAHAARVKATMDSPFRNEMEERMLKSKKAHRKTVFLVAVAAVCLLSVTALAVSFIPGWFCVSTGETEAPPAVESFENGYVYDTGHNQQNEITGEDGSVDAFESVSYVYEKNDESVWFSQDKPANPIIPSGDVVGEVNGVALYYHRFTNVIVPEGYEKTAEDLAAEAAGEAVFNEGSEEVVRMEVQCLSWSVDGVLSSLTQMDGSLTPEELADMAREIIGK